MKTLILTSFKLNPAILRQLTLVFFIHFICLGYLSSQTYDPETGNTHYPDGTYYIANSPHTGGPVVTGPERADGSWERVDCQLNPKRCGEMLKDATPIGGGGSSGDEDVPTPQWLDENLAAEFLEYRTKQLKMKSGVWIKQKGKWQHIENPSEWTYQIISSWKQKK